MTPGNISSSSPSWEELERIFRKIKPLSITYYRTVTADRAIQGIFPSLEGSISAGGRFNIPRKFGALYLSSTPQAALEEAIQTTCRVGFQKWKPKTIVEVKFQDIHILDLENKKNLEQIKVNREELEIDWNEENKYNRITTSQLIGKIARDCGFEAIRISSKLVDKAYNIAVFLDKISDRNVVITCEDRLP